VVYILDPKNSTQKGFVRRLVKDYKEKSPLEQLKMAVAVVIFAAATGTGFYHWVRPVASWAYESVITTSTVAPLAKPAALGAETPTVAEHDKQSK